MRRIKIIDRYVLKEFLRAFLGSNILVIGIVEITKVMDDLPRFLKNNVTLKDALIYFGAWVPVIFGKYGIPVGILFATSYVIGNFMKTNELYVMLSSGIRFSRVVRSIILFAFFLSVGDIFFNEFVVVRAFNLQDVWWYKINKILFLKTCDKKNLFMKGKDNTFYFVGKFDCKKKELKDLFVLRFRDSKVLFEISAKYAKWDSKNRLWWLYDAKIRYFSYINDKSLVQTVRYPVFKGVMLHETPKHFSAPVKKIEGMTYKEALERIEIAKFTGEPYRKYEVLLHWRFAFPFVGFVLVFIGSAIGAYVKKSVVILSFVFSLLAAFVYYSFVAIGKAMGEAGIVPPVVGAWFGNIVFIILGIILFKRSNM